MPLMLGQLLLITLIGYLWGSLPFGFWMGRLLRGEKFDIRDYGSHRTGATNVLRTLGTVPGIIVFVLDLSKGVLPTLLAISVPFFNVAGWGPTAAALAALLGHRFPIFIGFEGGRGVSTGAGATLIISPLTFLISAVISISTVAITRYVSLGSLMGCLTIFVCGILFFILGQSYPTFIGRVSFPELVFLVVGSLLVILFHWDNILRLLSGKERKIGQKEDVVSS
jgi:acyl phosphate:glycerol-3-phosphate acyltransferase